MTWGMKRQCIYVHFHLHIGYGTWFFYLSGYRFRERWIIAQCRVGLVGCTWLTMVLVWSGVFLFFLHERYITTRVSESGVCFLLDI